MKTPKGKKSRAKVKPRARLLEVASQRFYQNGLRATGIDLIIAEAGVAKMSFYRHFPSKNHLIAEYLRLQHEGWMDRLKTLTDHVSSGVGMERIADLLKTWFEEPTFRGCPFINAQAEILPEDRRVHEVIDVHQKEVESFFTEWLLALGYASPRTLAATVIVIMNGSIVYAQMTRESVVASEVCAGLLRKWGRHSKRLEDDVEQGENHQLLLAL